jgi:nucleoid-associated protein YgaU
MEGGSMGLFDFVKDAGQKLFGGGEQANTEAALNLKSMVAGMGIPVENLDIDVDGDKATVTGVAPTQADREKLVLLVGNVNGIAKVDDQLTIAPEPPATFYTVVSGDSLSKIAKAHYGDAMKYEVIFEANRPMLEHPDRIYPGQVLRIPPLK